MRGAGSRELAEHTRARCLDLGVANRACSTDTYRVLDGLNAQVWGVSNWEQDGFPPPRAEAQKVHPLGPEDSDQT